MEKIKKGFNTTIEDISLHDTGAEIQVCNDPKGDVTLYVPVQ